MVKRVSSLEKQKEAKEVPAEVIAQSIQKLGNAYSAMKASGLSERAVVILLADASKLPRSTVEKVLGGMDRLKSLYLK